MCNSNPEERELLAALKEDPAGEEGTVFCAGSFASSSIAESNVFSSLLFGRW